MEQTEQNVIPESPVIQNEGKERPAPAKKSTFSSLLPQIGKDVRWYFDIRLWAPVILVLLILCTCTGSSISKSATAKKYDADIQTMKLNWDAEKQALIEALTPPVADPVPVDPEAEALAILADAVGAGRSDNVKTAVMWIAVNRSERAVEGHGKPLLEEINMPQQWQGYDPEQADTYTYSQSTYEIAVEVLRIRDTGGLRPINNDMMWLVLNNDGSITIRNKYLGQNITEKTIK